MSKICPNCGDTIPDEAQFCGNCGYEFKQGNSNENLLKNGKIFIILIIIVLVIGFIIIFGMSNNQNDDQIISIDQNDGKSLEFTITEVNGYHDNYDGEDSYSLMAAALFTKVPSNLDGYIIKTTYYDNNDKQIGKVIESLSTIIFEETSNYPQAFGYYFTSKKLNPEYITVEIIKNGKTLQNVTFEVDKSRIEYLDQKDYREIYYSNNDY